MPLIINRGTLTEALVRDTPDQHFIVWDNTPWFLLYDNAIKLRTEEPITELDIRDDLDHIELVLNRGLIVWLSHMYPMLALKERRPELFKEWFDYINWKFEEYAGSDGVPEPVIAEEKINAPKPVQMEMLL